MTITLCDQNVWITPILCLLVSVTLKVAGTIRQRKIQRQKDTLFWHGRPDPSAILSDYLDELVLIAFLVVGLQVLWAR